MANQTSEEKKTSENEHVVAEDLGYSRVIYQDERLYRFTSDSILLSKFATAKKGDRVADFCSGCGIVAFHFYLVNGGTELSENADETKPNKAKNMRFTLFEMQEKLHNLAKITASANKFDNFDFCLGRLQDLPKEYYGAFSLILCNPPYETGGFQNDDYEKAVCRKELTICFKEIVTAAKKALKFGGRFALVHRADRVAEIIAELSSQNFAVKRLQFVAPHENKKPYLVLLEAVYGGKNGTDVLPVLINDAKTGGSASVPQRKDID